MSNRAAALKATAESANATIVAVVTAIAGLIVGLGVINPGQQGIIISTTTAGLAAAGLVANAIHNGTIEPSALATSVLAVVGQAVSLVVSFAWISNTQAGTVISISTAVVFAAAQVAHALLSRKVPA